MSGSSKKNRGSSTLERSWEWDPRRSRWPRNATVEGALPVEEDYGKPAEDKPGKIRRAFL